MNEGQAVTLRADVDVARDRPDDAIQRARQALVVIHREVGNRLGQARPLAVLGDARCRTDGIDAARRCWQQAHTLFDVAGAAPETDQLRALLTPEARRIRASSPGGPIR